MPNKTSIIKKIIEMENNAMNKTNDINEIIKNKLKYVDPRKLKYIETKFVEYKRRDTLDFWHYETSREKYNLLMTKKYLIAAKEKAKAVIDINPPVVSEIAKRILEKEISLANKIETTSHNVFIRYFYDATPDMEIPSFWDWF